MITKHFFKRLAVFLFMIALGMAGVLLLGNIKFNDKEAETVQTASEPCVGDEC
ncbi:MAG: hypothetical protein WAV15_03100 [Minisyncoccia bacterium]